jgi:hypothetical protein
MAKKAAERASGDEAAAAPGGRKRGFTTDLLSAASLDGIKRHKRSILGIAEDFGLVQRKMKDVAGDVLKLYAKIGFEAAAKGFTFTRADFARCFDPSVPLHVKATDSNPEAGYSEHKVYRAVDYIWRMENRTRAEKGTQGKRDPSRDQLARVLATLAVLFKDEAPLYKLVAEQFNMRRGIEKLKERVKETKPLLDLSKIIKLHSLDISKAPVVPMNRAAQGNVANLDEMKGVLKGLNAKGKHVVAQTGRRGGMRRTA